MKEETITFKFKVAANSTQNVWTETNTSHNTYEIKAIRLKGKNLRLLAVQVAVDERLVTKSEEIEVCFVPLFWRPFLELFLEVESPIDQEVEALIGVVVHPGETGFESPLD